MNSAVSRLQSANSVFPSSGDRDLRLLMKIQQGSQTSPGFEAWNSAFLLSFQRGARPLVELCRGIWAFSRA